MLNTSEFLKRLKIILDHHELSSAAFADLIHVQRSSISHLLNGRNKPSLEFIMKVNEAFPEVDLQWLLYNKGTFPGSNFDANPKTTPHKERTPIKQGASIKSIERVMIFYTDGTYKTYTE